MICNKHVNIVFHIKKNIRFTTTSSSYFSFVKVWRINLFLLKMEIVQISAQDFFPLKKLNQFDMQIHKTCISLVRGPLP